MLGDRIFFNAPLGFLFANEDLLNQYPINPEIFVDGEDLEKLDEKQVERARKLLDSHRLKRRVHGPISEMVPGAFDPQIREVTRRRFLQAVDFAEDIGAGAVVIHSGYDTLNKRNLEEGYLKNLAPALRSLAGEAAGKGVLLVLENTFEPDPDLLLEAVSGSGARNIRLCFDIAHHNVFGKLALEEWLARCAPLIEEVHITDNLGDWDDHLAPGKGRIDFGKFFGLLSKHGVRPIFAFEPHSVEHFVETLKFIKLNPGYFIT